MATNKKSFLLYCDVIHTVKQLTDEQAGKLFKHLLAYVNDENPEADDIITTIAFEPIKQSLKRDLRRFEDIRKRRSEAGKKGMEIRWNKTKDNNDSNSYNQITNITVNDSDSVINNNESEIIALYDTFLKEIENGGHQIVLERIKMQLKLESLKSLSNQFNTHLLAENILHPSTQKFLAHFKNLLNSMNAKGRLEEYKTIRKGSL